MNEALWRLATAAGIEERYWDGLGVQRELGEPTAVALLGALGIDAGTDAAAVAHALADETFLTPLPPAVVIRAAAATVTLALPQTRRDETIVWELALENGGRRTGELVAAQLQQLDTREIDGRHYGCFRLPLPDNLPLGYHRLRLPALAAETTLIVTPARCYIAPALQQGGRCWGFALQLYTLRSARNWGIGDFSDLAVLAAAAGRAGASFIGLNPLHARHLVKPDEASPYAPSSRLFLDPLYIDVEAVAEFADCAPARAVVDGAAFQGQLAAARQTTLVDYAAVTALKLPLLEQLFAHFQQLRSGSGSARAAAFEEFKRAGGAALARFAEFEALRLHLQAGGSQTVDWRSWPPALRDPASAALTQFRREYAERIDFQIYLQWIAAAQLGDAAAAARSGGMPLGLYCDLAVGAAHDSAETWSEQALFAHDVSVGAPPDLLNRQGQTWGLPPWNPRVLAQQAYAPLRRLLAANMRAAGALRIDHVMALTRLFWIPAGKSGADGGYVRNPFEALAAIVALESARNRCMVIGEDLGSVPDGLRARLHELGLLSYRVLIYERHWQGDGSFCRPEQYPPQSLATVATHDMPTLTEFWRGDDIGRRDALGMFPSPQQRDEEAARRDGERAGLLRLLGDLGLSPADPHNAADVVAALHGAIARTASMLAAVQLDDLIGEATPVNIPGTYREYPNWRRKLALPLEEILADQRWFELAALMRAAGRSSAG
jgi:(1->4)-alpha-D-glucan 1-alpha-D-glucosylmutase